MIKVKIKQDGKPIVVTTLKEYLREKEKDKI